MFKQVQLQISKAATFTAHSISMCAVVLLRLEGRSCGVGWGGTAGDFAMTTFYSTQDAPSCIAEMSLMVSSRQSYTLINTHREREGMPDKIN